MYLCMYKNLYIYALVYFMWVNLKTVQLDRMTDGMKS